MKGQIFSIDFVAKRGVDQRRSRGKHPPMRRGQIFSIDFVLGITILSLGLAIALQTMDLAQRTVDAYAQVDTNQAELLAWNVTNGAVGVKNVTPYCLHYVNQSTDGNGCASFTCPERVFVAQRIVECPGPIGSRPCLMEVRTCG